MLRHRQHNLINDEDSLCVEMLLLAINREMLLLLLLLLLLLVEAV
jgi:hypothetical protein